MENLFMKGDGSNPSVEFNVDESLFVLGGVSLPENVKESYEAILNWLDDFILAPIEGAVFEFRFEYLNTASSRIMIDIARKLEAVHNNGHKILVKWYYAYNDDDMYDLGDEIFAGFNCPYKLVLAKE